jgi:uncharacterized protein YndB with AHSA1/START domain
MADIIHRIGIKAPASAVYTAVSTVKGLSQWWTRETAGKEAVGGRIDFLFHAPTGELKGKMVMEVKELKPGSLARWACVEGPEEWVGTTIDFRLDFVDGMTILIFGHRGWREPVEFMAHCSMKWAVFMLSLKELVETGAGRPAPHDLTIDNWN